jgi:putative flippase GtrA
MSPNRSEKIRQPEEVSGKNHGNDWKTLLSGQLREVTAYLIVGVLTTVVYFGTYAVFKYFGVNYMVNSCFSWIAAVLFAFFANKYVVFRSMRASDLIQEMIRFFSARIVTLLMDLAITWSCIELLKIGEWKTKVLSQIVVMVLNYLFSKLFVFRKGRQA